jgi:ABC-2 type transport system ATP-binding protein
MLHLSEIKKQYSGQLILTIPSLSFDDRIFWIRGGNGSGKTTLLKMIAGLLPFEGSIRLNDVIDIKKNPVDYRRFVNYAEAEPLFPSFLSGFDLIHLFQKTKQGDENEITRLIEAFNINSYLSNPIGTYSSGMVKKLSLVLAFIGKPKIILLDEPLVTLEDHSIPILFTLINTYHTERKVTFLITSHQLLENTALSNMQNILVKDKTACFQ